MEALSDEVMIERVRVAARELAAALTAAVDGGVSQVRLVPELIGVMREPGLVPEGVSLPFGLGG